jgi:hypothetical protein
VTNQEEVTLFRHELVLNQPPAAPEVGDPSVTVIYVSTTEIELAAYSVQGNDNFHCLEDTPVTSCYDSLLDFLCEEECYEDQVLDEAACKASDCRLDGCIYFDVCKISGSGCGIAGSDPKPVLLVFVLALIAVSDMK